MRAPKNNPYSLCPGYTADMSRYLFCDEARVPQNEDWFSYQYATASSFKECGRHA